MLTPIISFPANSISAITTMGLDMTLHNTSNKWFIGASMGALRSIAIVQSNITKINYSHKLANFMIHLTYKYSDSPSSLTNYLETFFKEFINIDSLDLLLNHPDLHIGIMVAKLKFPFDKLPSFLIIILLILYLLLGILTPLNLTNLLFDKICYHSGDIPPPIENKNILFRKLTKDNILLVLRATTAVPFISKPVLFIDEPGYFIDGGICNYMCNFTPLQGHMCDIVLDKKLYNTKTYLDTFYFFTSRPNLPFTNYVPRLYEWFYREYVKDPNKRINKWKQVYVKSIRNANYGLYTMPYDKLVKN
jgi:hypothetical protein